MVVNKAAALFGREWIRKVPFARTLLSTTLLWGALIAVVVAQPETGAPTGDEAKDKAAADRFLTVLEKNPRRGTALDRVYGYAVEAGSLDSLVSRFQERLAKNQKDISAAMVLGLIEAQRGNEAEAAEAFLAAEQADPRNPLAPYYRAQMLILIGQTDEAVTALETSLSRKPIATDLLEVFQTLGRLHQRAQRSDKALEVWNRLEKQFPNDLRVQEQIATVMLEEGQFEQALPRFELLAKKSTDAYRQTMFKIEVASLRLRLKDSTGGLKDFESLLNNLNPESWLYREVRRRIEDVYLRTEDQDGLVKYYTQWIESRPEDVDAIARLAKILSGQSREPEAREWMEKALAKAPSNQALRRNYIDLLDASNQTAKVLEQYALMDKNDPNNTDTLRSWGRAILADKSQPEADRKAAATALWRRLANSKPKDATLAAQVADLFRQSGLSEEALAEYKRAVELAPDQPQYREYLGEYLHQLKRGDEAIAVWSEIAAGSKKTAANLGRLAEVLSGFGYIAEAETQILEAIKLDPKDFALRLQAADLFVKREQYAPAIETLAAAANLAEGDDQKETVFTAQVRVFQIDGSLTERAENLSKELKAGKDVTPDRWLTLARYLETERKLPEASAAVNTALELSPESIPTLAAAARIQEASGNMLGASNVFRKLAQIDRRFRTDYLTQVVRLEQQLGRNAEALQAGRDLIAAAPGNTDHYQTYAQLCFRLGQQDEGLNALRRSVRLNPADPAVVLELANSLANLFRTDEAIELYWQALEKTTSVDDKLPIINKLAESYQQTNQFDKLLERLERRRKEANEKREPTLILAQAHQAASDFGSARVELEQLLGSDTRDTQLLQQLSKLAESEDDIPSALRYQHQVVAVAPTPESKVRLAALHSRNGDLAAASDIWVQLTTEEKDPERVLRSIDNLISNSRSEEAIRVLESLRRDDPNNWELIYREGMAYADTDAAKATERFKSLLALSTPDQETGLYQKAAQQRNTRSSTQNKSGNARSRNQQTLTPVSQLLRRLQDVQMPRYISRWQQDVWNYSYYRQQSWSPGDFGQARLTALGFLGALSREQSGEGAFRSEQDRLLEEAVKDPQKNLRQLWDQLYFSALAGDSLRQYRISLTLARALPDELTTSAFLQAFSRRALAEGERKPDSGSASTSIPADELDLAVKLYHDSRQRIAAQNTQEIGLSIDGLARALHNAGREEDAKQLQTQAFSAVKEAKQWESALSQAISQELLSEIPSLFQEYISSELQKPSSNRNEYNTVRLTTQYLDLCAVAKRHSEIGPILEQYFRFTQSIKATSKTNRSTNPQYYGGQYSLYVNKNQQYIVVAFPKANEHLDWRALTVLNQAFHCFKRDDLISDLIRYLEQRKSASTGPEQLHWSLSLAAVHWWGNDRDAAVNELTAASESAPNDARLRLQVAQVYFDVGDLEDALAAADSIVAVDQQLMKDREQFSLKAAVRLGRADRARQAAERLFGLRLSSQEQIDLAAKMRELGQYSQADAVIARAQRQAGNKLDALVSVMQQYAVENKTDIANQMAFQILRRRPASLRSRPSSQYSYSYNRRQGDDGPRDAALQVLASSGRLKEMAGRLEKQLEATPDSVPILSQLNDYYQRLGDQRRRDEITNRLADLQPADATLQISIANSLFQAGKSADGCERVLKAIDADITQANNGEWYTWTRHFASAKMMDKLAASLEKALLDRTKTTQQLYIDNMFYSINSYASDSDKVLFRKLFGKIWKNRADLRQRMIYMLQNDPELAMLPEVLDEIRAALFPKEPPGSDRPWAALENSFQNYNENQTSPAAKVIEASMRNNTLEKDLSEIDAILQKAPHWTPAKITRILILVRLARVDEVKSDLEKLLALPEMEKMPDAARVALGMELEPFPDLLPFAERVYAGTQPSDPLSSQNHYLNNNQNPTYRLIQLYQKLDRKDAARELVLRAAKVPEELFRYNEGYRIYVEFHNSEYIASTLSELGYIADAIGIYRNWLSRPEDLRALDRFYGGGDGRESMVRNSLAGMVAHINSENADSVLQALLTSPSSAAANRAASSPTNTAELKPAPAPKTDTFDITPTVEDDESGEGRLKLETSQLTTLLEKVFKQVLKSPVAKSRLLDRLAKLQTEQPDDYSVQLVITLVRLMGDAPIEESKSAVSRLLELVDRNPLDELPVGMTANARQRNQALPQVSLWLVANHCISKPELFAEGVQLANRAMLAAGRQADSKMALAIRTEYGSLLLKGNRKEEAELVWAGMIDAIVPPPKPASMRRRPFTPPAPPAASAASAAAQVKQPAGKSATKTPPAPKTNPKSPAANGTSLKPPDRVKPFSNLVRLASFAQAAAPAPVPRPKAVPKAEPPETRGSVAPLTKRQFRQMTDVARLAAKNGLVELSLRTMRRAVEGGPAIDEQATTEQVSGGSFSSMPYMSEASEFGGREATTAQVFKQLAIDWRIHDAPPSSVYEVLELAVFPPTRQGEILLQFASQNQSGDSLCTLLVKQAIAANRTDDLLKQIVQRQELPAARLAASLLRCELAIRQRNSSAVQSEIEALSQQLDSDANQTVRAYSVAAAVSALRTNLAVDSATALIAKTIEKTPGKPSHAIVNTLATIEYNRGNTSAARAWIEKVASATEDLQVTESNSAYATRQFLVQSAAAARGGRQLDDVLTYLGRAADIPVSNTGVPQQEWSSSFRWALLTLLSRPAEERYTRLRDWVLPNETRRGLRSLVVTIPFDFTPQSLIASTDPADAPNPEFSGAVCPMQLLVAAAQEVGKLDELQTAVDRLVEQKLVNADVLRAMIQIRKGDKAAEEFLRLRMEDYKPKPPPEGDTSRNVYVEPTAHPLSEGHKRPLDVQLVRSALQIEALTPLAVEFVKLANFQAEDGLRTRFTEIEAKNIAGVSSFVPTKDPGLNWWNGFGPRSGDQFSRDNSGDAPWWCSYDGHLVRYRGFRNDGLFFAAPLLGEFDVSLDVFCSGNLSTAVSYGGFRIGDSFFGSVSIASTGSDSDSRMLDCEVPLRLNDWNQVKLEVRKDFLRWFLNGHLMYQSATAPAANDPWLKVRTSQMEKTSLRNLRITGRAEVPKEVSLCIGDQFDGWTGRFPGDRLPKKFSSEGGVGSGRPGEQLMWFNTHTSRGRIRRQAYWYNPATQYYRQANVTELDLAGSSDPTWKAAGGEISAQPMDRKKLVTHSEWLAAEVRAALSDSPVNIEDTVSIDSGLQYHRPMNDGETLSYEFFFEPGKTEVHPRMGELTLLLQPDGVAIAFSGDQIFQSELIDENDEEPSNQGSGSPAARYAGESDNLTSVPSLRLRSAVEPATRRGPSPLPLKPGEWNQAQLQIQGDTLRLSLNGELICERIIEPSNSRRPGFWRNAARTAARIRNITLRGEWPGPIPVDASPDVFMSTKSTPEPNLRRLHAVFVGEDILAASPESALSGVYSLPPAERYAALRDWVLPNDSRATFRMQGWMQPVQPAGGETPKSLQGQRRVVSGGKPVLPAADLVAVAAELKKLDELTAAVDAAPAWGDANENAKLAIQTLILLAQRRNDAAVEKIKKLAERFKTRTDSPPYHERWGELSLLLVLSETGAMPDAAFELLTAINDDKLRFEKANQYFLKHDLWARLFLQAFWIIHARHYHAGSALTFVDNTSTASGWRTISEATSASRGTGLAGGWIAAPAPNDRFVRRIPGGSFDRLMPAMPLRGDFEVTAQINGFGLDFTVVSYAGLEIQVDHERKKVQIIAPGKPDDFRNLDQPLEMKDWFVDMKLSVKNQLMRVHLNNTLVSQTAVSPDSDPWLSFGYELRGGGAVRDVRITGSPEAPSEIHLCNIQHVNAWRAYHVGSIGTRGAPLGHSLNPTEGWQFSGEEFKREIPTPDQSTEPKSPTPKTKDPVVTTSEILLRYYRPLLEDGSIEYEFFYTPGKTVVHPALDRLACVLTPEGVKIHWVTDGGFERTGLSRDNIRDDPASRRGPAPLPLKADDWNKARLEVTGDTLRLHLNGELVFERPIEPTNDRTFGFYSYREQGSSRVRRVVYRGDWAKSLPDAAALKLAGANDK